MNDKTTNDNATDAVPAENCDCAPGCCGPTVQRRDFLRLTALGVATGLTANMPAMAGPFETADFDKMIPADKKLDPAWVKSLFARGSRTVYRGTDLEKIGMPVGGICCGQLYLGGDGKLWHWDIYNKFNHTESDHYPHPPQSDFPLEQGFAIRVSSAAGEFSTRSLDHTGFAEIEFNGEYPVGFVKYSDAASPAEVRLEAFPAFIPLNADDSHLPATVMQFTVKNTSSAAVQCELAGWLQNAVCPESGVAGRGSRTNSVVRGGGLTLLNCTAQPPAPPARPGPAPTVFADFEGTDYAPWKVEGEAFGTAPAKGARPSQVLSGFMGKGLANSFNGTDSAKGKLTSPNFTVQRPYISFLIGGGKYPGQTCINLLVDGKVVRTETGKNLDAMAWANWDVRDQLGKTAHLEIVDAHGGPWGHIEIDQIQFDDQPHDTIPVLNEQSDFGSMCLALLDAKPNDLASAALGAQPPPAKGALPNKPGTMPKKLFGPTGLAPDGKATQEFPGKPIGAIGREFSLEPGAEAKLTFVIAWHFPNLLYLHLSHLEGRLYGKRFHSAHEVAQFVGENFTRLAGETRLWHDTWYDSTLPYWFLDRTFATVATLATSTCCWFGNGRFYGYEGVGCCNGTCTHVWHYAQAVSRIFPTLERTTREMVDFGIAFDASGAIRCRAEEWYGWAIDGQAGTILRAYREHQMSADDSFLKRNWPKIKQAMQFLMKQEGGESGLLTGNQFNTLDASWFGPIAWISGLYLAALRASEAMAHDMDDEPWAKRVRGIFDLGRKAFVDQLFDLEYFINKPDPKNAWAINSGTGCEIDQVFGQSWAFQVGLPRVLPAEQTRSALKALWKYNFTPDVGPFRKANKPGRWMAMPGEGGLLMCTFPRTDWDYERATGKKVAWPPSPVADLNECMTGFEHQVAGHMIWEGLVQEGLAVIRTIHDRYHASRRNPWNEVECGDHYSRAMAGYGVYVAACGYEHHGPNGYLAFAPRLTPENFRCAFTTAEGWGTFSQKREGATQNETIELKWGKLRLKTLAFALPDRGAAATVAVAVGKKPLDAKHVVEDGRVRITLAAETVVDHGETLTVRIN